MEIKNYLLIIANIIAIYFNCLRKENFTEISVDPYRIVLYLKYINIFVILYYSYERTHWGCWMESIHGIILNFTKMSVSL